MAVPIKNILHVQQGLARLTSAYIIQPNVRALLAAYLLPLQELEYVFWDILKSRILSKATIYSLPLTNITFDQIGALIGLNRQGASDIDYRALIYLEIAVNRCTGRMSDWSRFAQILSAWCDDITFLDGDNADFAFTTKNITLPPIIVGSQLARATENGVGGVFIWTTWNPSLDLLMSDSYDGSSGQASGQGGLGAWPYGGPTGGIMAMATEL